MVQKPVSGFGFVASGLSLITKPGIKRFVIIPILINVVVFTLLAWYGYSQFDQLMEWLLPKEAWYSFLRWLLWPLFLVAIVLIVFSTFTVLANLIASPFNAVLASRVEEHLRGEKLAAADEVNLSTVKSIGMAIRKTMYFFVWAIPLLLLFFIPVVNIIAPITWFLFSAWFLALEYTEFPMSNHNINFDEQRQRLRKRKMMSIGFGSGLTFLMMVPFLNFLAMPIGVAGATKMWVDSLSQ